MGKVRGEPPKTEEGVTESSYTPMPITSLRDPGSFAPPPKRTGAAGRASPGTNPAGGSAYARPAAQQPEPEPEEERPPPQPYRKDTTGLSTAHLPPPPGRRDGADRRAPAPPIAPRAPPQTKPKPSLPPRLPPRQTEHVDEHTPAAPPPYSLEAEPPAHQGILNQGAMNRLGAAGVSVPGFDIAPSPSPPLPARRQAAAPPPPAPAAKPSTPQLGELQSRFAKFSTSSPEGQQLEPTSAGQGTTWAQKQAALKTASSFRNDPSSVSFSDARAAASIANNFRERHGAQVATGLQSANNINNKYGLADKAAAYGAGTGAPQSRAPEQVRDYSNGMNLDGQAHSTASKKAPPPPPKKRPDLVGTQKDSGPPPPIPISSKPKPPVSSYKY